MKKLTIILGVLAVLLVAGLYVTRVRTPRIENQNGESVPGAVASLEPVELGGREQWILIRGHSTSNPLLLFLHGGPGMPMMYMAHVFGHGLEQDFLVVHWDQRGAGKSYDPDLPVETMNVEQFLSDTHELVRRLTRRFGHERIYLAGHSWGSYLGTLYAARHPERLHAYIGIGQVVDERRATEIADAFIRRRARETGDEEALAELNDQGAAAREKWLFRFGGELYHHTNWTPFLLAGLFAPEYSLTDAVNVGRGSSFSSRHMNFNAIDGPLIEEVTRLEVPVYFFQGRHDFVTPAVLVEEYHARLEAPAKDIVWFDDSAHFPFFEQPQRFTAEMRRLLAER
ncbi:MAG: alpha/beta hydrolase [Gemmatimonadetes bacterium]|uniref:Proline iminopeptidase n=1 Tax=Candidatus Kutchimonas denitrificans TaxID=3056748 RepID=A0AAE5CC31_9BACT|nr:alpha/beta hydrolase [Gemmatimonadota bacterium]NIR76607.1 alpha/beta hydrolase [Candidatus Kutchimonas denitrificans]NIS03376.1 alpha/beta hydrolase [Gemmatimonadota bacterium]NIT69237.1 alpha/beta hydrolase [Gemmatimonadota bacterium]NIU54709.1 alpha/beta fold hydrolase [Gemmatimonadota bacterium]